MARWAIFADIHANGVALEAVLADLTTVPVDRLVCLGDIAGGGPQPAQVVARLRALHCPIVLGNADALLFEAGLADGRTAVRAWTWAQLTAADRAFLRTLPPTITLPIADDRALLCFHGSPASYDDAILPGMQEGEFRRLLAFHAPHVLTGGHTHLAQLRPLDDTFFFNPGSVGYPGHRPASWAEYAILTVEGARVGVEFRQVPYSVADLIAAFESGGHPDRARHIVRLAALVQH